MDENKIIELIENAIKARNNSYCPYSNYAVGAAVLAGDVIYTGCNVENASYGATNCAERTAVFKAVSEGIRKVDAIAIVGGKKGADELDYAFPCGVCRQVLREFSNPKDLHVIVAKSVKNFKEYKLEELLPESFGPENLK